MNIKRFAKAAAGVFALAFMLSAVSCSFSKSEPSKASSGSEESEITEETPLRTYHAEEIGSPLEIDSLTRLEMLGDTGKVLVTGTAGRSGIQMYLTDLTFSTYDELQINTGAGEESTTYYCAGAAPGGNIVTAATVIDYGDFKMPDFDDPEFDSEEFDYDAMIAAANVSFKLITLDSSGKQISSKEIKGMEKYSKDDDPDTYPAISNIFACDDSTYIIFISEESGTSYALMDDTGKITRELDFGEEVYLNSLCRNNDGGFAFSAWVEDNVSIRTIDPETFTINSSDIPVEIGLNNYLTSIAAGKGEYEYYALCSENLIGVKKGGKEEKIIKWDDSNLDGDGIAAMLALDNDEFIVYESSFSGVNSFSGAGKFYKLTPYNESEHESVTSLTLAMIYDDANVSRKIAAFNRSSDKYHINVESYSEYFKYDSSGKAVNTPVKQLRQDIADGKDIDMVCFSDTSVFYGMSTTDAFADLSRYLGKNGTITREELMPSMLDACSENGKLQFVTPNFSIRTYAAKSKNFSKENWTLDDLIKAFDSLPDNARLLKSGSTKVDVFGVLAPHMNFIDWSKKTCTYDSPEFIKLLEFCNRFPETPAIDEYVSDEAPAEKRKEYLDSHEGAMRSDRALIDYIDLSCLMNYNHAKYCSVNEDITLVGFPSPNGNGAEIVPNNGFAIVGSSANKDECWSFISSFFTDEYQDANTTWCIPSRISAFEKVLEEAGKPGDQKEIDYFDGEPVDIPPLSEEEQKAVREYIMNAGNNNAPAYNSAISAVISEEADAYFTGKTTDAKATASQIQKRVTELLNE